ncbi:MAG: hypothetical protein M3444_03055 [Acidobacteriota bacterium]|nr:hypothetical protein [Acidobacteriota bacterium]MDQ5836096.1 hypothetical protein [Acidobacteriota bacterium]
MHPAVKQAQQQAISTLKSSWKEIAKNYSLSGVRTIQETETILPHVSKGIADIRSRITPVLPIAVYQTRQSPPENTVVVIPYDPDYQSRVVSIKQLSDGERELLGRFAQSIWFLIHSGALPHPFEEEGFEQQLISLTGESLFQR